MSYQKTGFSLMEMMVTMAIIAILGMIVVPAYRNYIDKSHLTEIFHAVKQDQSNIVAYTSLNPMPTDATTASNMVTNINGLAVCNSSYVSTTEGDCTFGQYGIRVATKAALIPDVRINFTPKQTGKLIQWDCTYESDSSADGVALLPIHCKKLTNSSNTTPLW